MKPKAPNVHEDGLLEYLEDIIGYKEKQNQLKDKLSERKKNMLKQNKITKILKINMENLLKIIRIATIFRGERTIRFDEQDLIDLKEELSRLERFLEIEENELKAIQESLKDMR
ncbi:hypothetical protein C1645_822413 [Glomus cerebriforme]|uniref:Uncharacterized protein n=1 Tax=Glomus cerebriforme TaxID=658196 RepID=A0A397SY96_9GLOM|nr:hypothetical protein C1645_822413 [Glomus cerebriforme]